MAKVDENYTEKLINAVAKMIVEAIENISIEDVNMYQIGYNKAITEFAEKLSLEISESIIWDMLATMSKNGSLSDTSDKIVDYVIDTSKKIAEEMRGAE